jgi:Biopolymer transport protein ExbD/TolR.
MAKFSRKGKGGTPELSTSSLADIVFMILLFFMVTTSMRQTERMVAIKMPAASEIAKLEEKTSQHIFMLEHLCLIYRHSLEPTPEFS